MGLADMNLLLPSSNCAGARRNDYASPDEEDLRGDAGEYAVARFGPEWEGGGEIGFCDENHGTPGDVIYAASGGGSFPRDMTGERRAEQRDRRSFEEQVGAWWGKVSETEDRYLSFIQKRGDEFTLNAPAIAERGLDGDSWLPLYCGGVAAVYTGGGNTERGMMKGEFALESVPNPSGKVGSLRHQAYVEDEARAMRTRYASAIDIEVRTEVRIVGRDGQVRYVDAQAYNVRTGEIVDQVQVGRTNKNGTPVSRERTNMEDIDRATGVDTRYRPYDR
jgi:hypothetical protein